MELAVPLLVSRVVADLIEGAAIVHALNYGAIKVIRVQKSAPAGLLGNLDQTVFFIEPLESFFAICIHMRVDCQRHPAVRISACVAGI